MKKPTPPPTPKRSKIIADQMIREEGCLAAVIDVYARQLQRSHAHIFEVAHLLNRVALAAWMDAENVGEKADIIPVANRLMFRAINSFGASVTLAKRGLDSEAQTLARGIYECAFWLGYFVAESEQALDHFKIENKRSVLSHHILLDDQGMLDADEAALCRRVYDDLKRVKIPGMEKMAAKGDLKLAFSFYKYLCGMAAHSSMASLDRYLDEEIEGRVAHAFDFSGENIPETVAFGITGMLAALTKWQAISHVPLDELLLSRFEAEATLMFAGETSPAAAGVDHPSRKRDH